VPETDLPNADQPEAEPLPKATWPIVNYADALAAIRFLGEAFGFEERLVVAGDRPGEVVHAELRFPEGGGVMLGTADRPESVFSQLPTGVTSVYVVTDEPDAIHQRALAAGAELVKDLEDEDYGSRGFSVRDPEGNLWSFGTYRGT
jgi:uncharacterized glyoxalase superfamily protein PhnB